MNRRQRRILERQGKVQEPEAKWTPNWNKPTKVSTLDSTFGGVRGGTEQIMPRYDVIPEEFRRWGPAGSPWCRWQSDWFFHGLRRFPVPKPGIDLADAMAHLSAIQRSFDTAHEHKAAAVAYLASLWFESPDGKDKL